MGGDGGSGGGCVLGGERGKRCWKGGEGDRRMGRERMRGREGWW